MRCLPSLILVAALVVTEPVPSGKDVPALVHDLEGRSRPMRDPVRSGRILLVSFVAMERPRGSDRRDPNRSQAVFTRSMGLQFESDGLKTVLVGIPPAGMTRGELRNVGFAWGSNLVEVVFDPREAVARSYGVDLYPTTLLLDAEDRILNRWEGFAPAHALASAIRDGLRSVDGSPGLD